MTTPTPTPTPTRRSTFDVQDETLLFKSLLPIKTMVGFGMVLGAVPSLCLSLIFSPHPRKSNSNYNHHPSMLLWSTLTLAPLVVGSLMMVQGTLYNLFYKAITGNSRDPLTQRVVAGRKTVIRQTTNTNGEKGDKDDFVVFLIGARVNNQVDSFYKWMGDSMDAMLQELEEHPEYGCLGTEQFQGVTGGLLVQYWTSLEALNKYARNATNQHSHPWSIMMKMGRECTDYGVWHEAFQVKNGNYDAIYVNMPPVFLGNALGSTLVDAKGKYASGAGRAGNSDGSDYPKELGDPNY